MSQPSRYFILALARCRGDMLVWYCPDSLGYTTLLDKAGTYTEEQVKAGRLNEGSTAAVPVEVATRLSRLVVHSDHKQLLVQLAGTKDPDFRVPQ